VTTFNYSFANAQLGLQWRHLPSIKDETASRDPGTRILGVGSYDTFSLFARYEINDRMQFRGGIENLFDEEPPVVSVDPGTATLPRDNNLGDTEAGFYDVLGRRAYIGIQMNF
jgi:outer membrane receptor protein involved in Fe transport